MLDKATLQKPQWEAQKPLELLTVCAHNNDGKLKNQYKRLKDKLNRNFKNAKTVEDANKWAEGNLKVKHVDYDGFDINVANMINREIYILQQLFPEVMPKINCIARMDKLLRDRNLVTATQKAIVDNLIRKARAKSVKATKLYKKGNKMLNTIHSLKNKIKTEHDRLILNSLILDAANKVGKTLYNTAAIVPKGLGTAYLDIVWYLSQSLEILMFAACYLKVGEYKGIYFHPLKAKDTSFSKFSYKIEGITNHAPEGTNNIKGTLHHEFGHALAAYLKEQNMESVVKSNWKNCRKGLTGSITGRTKISKGLSGYANSNQEEFNCEALSEYFTSESPRQLAKTVVEDILQIFKTIRSNKSIQYIKAPKLTINYVTAN